MELEVRFINLIQTVLLIRAQRGHWFSPLGSRTLLECEILHCLDDANYYACRERRLILTGELHTIAIQYVNNWLKNTPGFRKDTSADV